MALAWKQEEQVYILHSISLYRKEIDDKTNKDAIQITKKLAEEIHQKNPALEHRTINSIAERLPYLENLLAGVFEKEHYAKKDQHLYYTKPRENISRVPNLCNTRHAYHGAMTDYLKEYQNDSMVYNLSE